MISITGGNKRAAIPYLNDALTMIGNSAILQDK